MSDLFDTEVPIEWFSEAWDKIEICNRLAIQIVTKRISVVEKRLSAIGRTAWPRHAGLMITVVNQVEADRDIPRLLALKAKLGIPWVGLSVEPMLGPIDLSAWLHRLDWVICGGESGRHARPLHPDWARTLRDQCAIAAVPFLFKQWGAWRPEIDRDNDDPDWRQPYTDYREPTFRILNLAGGHGFHGERVHVMRFCSKKSAGRLLDGVTHDAMAGALA